MSIDRKASHHAAKVMAATGLDLLTDPELLQSVKDDFVGQLDGQTYESLNDFDKNPIGELDDTGRHDDECALHAALEHFGISEHERPPT